MKNNPKIIIVVIIIALISIIAYTYSSKSENFVQSIFGETLQVDELAYGETEFNSDNIKLIPILDENLYESKDYIINISFNVGGSEKNTKEEIVYDIALVDLEIDCDLLSPYLKWRLVKNELEIYEGSFDYRFDTIKNGRLVLTPIQQDLKEYNEDKNTYDHYEFYIWLSDSCQDEIVMCIANNNIINQSQLQGKQIKGKIEVELYGESKKILKRTPSTTLNKNTCIEREGDNNDTNR